MPQPVGSLVSFPPPASHLPSSHNAQHTQHPNANHRFANAGVNILTDILVATLPLPFLNHLQLPNRQRIALMIVFALGGTLDSLFGAVDECASAASATGCAAPAGDGLASDA